MPQLPHGHQPQLKARVPSSEAVHGFHNGRTEGVNTRKMIKRQMYGRAGFALLRHRVLLGSRNVTTGNATEPLS